MRNGTWVLKGAIEAIFELVTKGGPGGPPDVAAGGKFLEGSGNSP
jgi:hypothetical protein